MVDVDAASPMVHSRDRSTHKRCTKTTIKVSFCVLIVNRAGLNSYVICRSGSSPMSVAKCKEHANTRFILLLSCAPRQGALLKRARQKQPQPNDESQNSGGCFTRSPVPPSKNILRLLLSAPDMHILLWVVITGVSWYLSLLATRLGLFHSVGRFVQKIPPVRICSAERFQDELVERLGTLSFSTRHCVLGACFGKK